MGFESMGLQTFERCSQSGDTITPENDKLKARIEQLEKALKWLRFYIKPNGLKMGNLIDRIDKALKGDSK